MVETRGGRRFAIIFLVAAFLVLLLGRWLKPVDNLALSVAAPFASAINSTASEIGDTVSGVLQGPSLRSQNTQLKTELASVLRKNLLLQEQAHQNKLLARMLRFSNLNNRMDLLPGRVIGEDPNSQISPYLLINLGTRDGLRVGMTVLDQNGYFVGTISELTGNASKVLPVFSPSSDVGAVDLQTRATGVVEGLYGSRPQFKFVVASASLVPGDFVMTSGQMNLYPRNLLIGQIVGVNHRNVSVFQSAAIEPAADFQHLEMVQIVRNFVPSVPSKLLTGQ